MKNLIEIVNNISEEAKNQFKPDLKKYGKNFRAISESAVLDVLNPLLKKYNIGYEVEIKDKSLIIEKVNCGRDIEGNTVEKLVFIAEAKVRLVLRVFDEENPYLLNQSLIFEGWGSGVDSGDKATGKAITAAVKYALFKGFRLQYSDDPDAETSEDIENIVEDPKKEKPEKTVPPKKKTENKKTDEPCATEAQLNYIKGLAIACGLSDEEFKNKYGFYPYEAAIPMRKARDIIDELKKLQEEKLPF